MIKNDKLEELKLYITQKINEEQNSYSKLLADLNSYIGSLSDTDDIKKLLERVYVAKDETLKNILQKIRSMQ